MPDGDNVPASRDGVLADARAKEAVAATDDDSFGSRGHVCDVMV